MATRYSFVSGPNWFPVICLLIVLFLGSCKPPPLPTLEEINPTTVSPGEFIRLSGTSLDYRSALMIGEIIISEQNISGDNDRLDVRIPDNFEAGSYEVFLMTEEGSSTSQSLTVSKAITGLSPSVADIGEQITLRTNFPPQKAEVFFPGGVKAETEISEYSVLVTVPDSARTGRLEMRLEDQSSLFSPLFQVEAPPVISGVDQDTGWVDLAIRISGNHFIDSQLSVIFSPGIEAEILNNSLTELSILVPDGAESGPLTVSTAFGQAQIQFWVILNPAEKPFVNQLIPDHIPIGCSIKIKGGNFDASTEVILPFSGSTIPLSGSALTISPEQDEISLEMFSGIETGEVIVRTSRGTTIGKELTIVEKPIINEVFPGKNALGGQVIIEVQEGASVNRILFGGIPITGVNNGFEYVKYSDGDEIIATNVPNGGLSTNETIFLEIAEGCVSNGAPFEVETNKTSLNAPLAGGAHTVVIPSSLGSIEYINNEWMAVTGDFGDRSNQVYEKKAFSYCGCLDSSGTVLLFEPFPGCFDDEGYAGDIGEKYALDCASQPEFNGKVPIGFIKGSRVEIFGEYYGRVDGSKSSYGASRILLSPYEGGDQIEITFPEYIESVDPSMVAPGEEITLTGQFDSLSTAILLGYGPIASQIQSNNELKITLPQNEEDYDILQNWGTIEMEYFDGTRSNDIDFDIIGPTLSSISPDTVSVGTIVTITGEFVADQPLDERLLVLIDGEEISPYILSSTECFFVVPSSLDPGSTANSTTLAISYWTSGNFESISLPITITP